MPVTIGRSAKNYQERKGPELRTTRRGPGPMWAPEQNAYRSFSLTPPLPLPALLHSAPVQDPPDGQETQVWPFGNDAYVEEI